MAYARLRYCVGKRQRQQVQWAAAAAAAAAAPALVLRMVGRASSMNVYKPFCGTNLSNVCMVFFLIF